MLAGATTGQKASLQLKLGNLNQPLVRLSSGLTEGNAARWAAIAGNAAAQDGAMRHHFNRTNLWKNLFSQLFFCYMPAGMHAAAQSPMAVTCFSEYEYC